MKVPIVKNNSNFLYKVFTILNSNNESEISKLYYVYKDDFRLFLSSRYGVNGPIVNDIYQESFLAAYENVRSGKLKTLNSSFKTYLLGIGKNVTLNYLRKNNRLESVDIEIAGSIEFLTDSDEERIHDIVFSIVDTISDPCNTVLKLFFWKKKSHKEIAEAMNYKNADVAKQRKNLCMETLRKIVKEKLTQEGYQ